MVATGETFQALWSVTGNGPLYPRMRIASSKPIGSSVTSRRAEACVASTSLAVFVAQSRAEGCSVVSGWSTVASLRGLRGAAIARVVKARREKMRVWNCIVDVRRGSEWFWVMVVNDGVKIYY